MIGEGSDAARGRKRKRGSVCGRRKPPASTAAIHRWQTDRDQRLYSSKLVAALRRVRATPPPRQPSRLVRAAADRALAFAAKGVTRWSRAILSPRPAGQRPLTPARSAPVKRKATKKARSSAVERKAKVLGRLVPGCRKVALPSLLDETCDYISALEMQIRAMTALTEFLATAGGGPPPPPQTS